MKQIVTRPVITEKSLQYAGRGWYTFAVALASNKAVIAEAIGNLYKVNVTDVRTIIMHGKEQKHGKRSQKVRQSDWKKALVRLKTGQKIDAFEVTSHDSRGESS